jgi:peptidoglycan/xylan/chitin deacetylase (PgdA/CDA1 family)
MALLLVAAAFGAACALTAGSPPATELASPTAGAIVQPTTPLLPTRTPTPALQPTNPATPTPPPTAIRVAAPTSSPTPRPAASQPPTPTQPPPTLTPPPTAKPALTPPAASDGRPGQLVALTFDAGADRGYAEDILDVLRDQRVPASFGLTGRWARANPDLVSRIAAEGHLVINHTLDHRSFTGVSDNLGGLSAARRRAELEDADAIIAALTGRSTKPWYRLPYGDDDARVAADVAPAGYTHKAGWTVDSMGWRGLSAADIVARCLQLAAPNAVYVFHVGRASQDGPALPRLIASLRERGFGFATMAELP